MLIEPSQGGNTRLLARVALLIKQNMSCRMMRIIVNKAFYWSFCLVLPLACSLVARVFAETSYTAANLADLNDSYWRSVHSVDMTYIKTSFYGSKQMGAWSLPTRWLMSPTRERLLYSGSINDNWAGGKTSASPQLRHDWYYDGSHTYHLVNKDLTSKPPASGYEAKQDRKSVV